MSFIDLMACDVWSEADIVSRTEAMIAGEFSPQAVAILQRKVTAQMLGMYTMTTTEQAELARYAAVSTEAQAAGLQARADMALLAEVLAVEAGAASAEALPPTAQALYALRRPAAIEQEGSDAPMAA